MSTWFYGVNAQTIYNLLFEQVWMHLYDAIFSTSHQFLKAIWKDDILEILASTYPFGAS